MKTKQTDSTQEEQKEIKAEENTGDARNFKFLFKQDVAGAEMSVYGHEVTMLGVNVTTILKFGDGDMTVATNFIRGAKIGTNGGNSFLLDAGAGYLTQENE
jgi:hypothetical protein